ncbi:MAG: ABC transporter permease [Deltaproteobacteria bacterium]|nr:ABC transporter permease [Deltaproteobacteria bacterium]MBN2688186.1 ABC transporter permease [Deltaproteobacteria bacterium]
MSTVMRKIYGVIIALLLVAVGVGLQRTGTISLFSDPYAYPELVRLLWQHLYLVGVSMAIAITIGLSVGIILTRPRFRSYTGVIMYVVSLGQTIPSLAVLALVMAFLGIGAKSAIFALTIYSLLPIARNTLAGINAVPASIIDAAKGMGMTTMGILWQVEIPMALTVILTGIRVALVINIGTTALAYLIGAGGMGDWIFTGINMMMTDKLIAGALPVTFLALFADFIIEVLRVMLVSKGLRITEE